MKEITKWNYEYINNKELQDYLNYIKQFEVLKKEEQITLFNKYQKGDKNAFKKLINHNLGLSVTIAKTFIGSTTSVINIFDLINEGNLALINAVKSFNPEKDVKFSSYAGIIIKQQLTKYVLENSKGFNINIHTMQRINKLKSIISEIYSTQEFEQNKIEQSIKSQIQDFLKTFNQNNEIESIKEEINIEIEKTIHKYIQDLRSKIITTQSEEIYNNKSENLKEDFESKINEIKNLNNFKIEYFNLKMIFSDIFNEIKHKMPFINCQEQCDEALKFSQIFKDKIQKYNDQLQRILEEKRREIFEQTMNKIIEEKLEFLEEEMERKKTNVR